MKLYDFNATMCGWGDTVEEAFDIDKQELPDYELVEEDHE